jgi:hypothetical protein
VYDVRYLFVAACLGAAATHKHVPASQAGSVKTSAKASYSTANSAPV